MAQTLLDFHSSELLTSSNKCKNSYPNNCNGTTNQGTSSILRKLRYRTGKLKTNISFITDGNKGTSSIVVHSPAKPTHFGLDDSLSCDDPGETVKKPQLPVKKTTGSDVSSKKCEKIKRQKGISTHTSKTPDQVTSQITEKKVASLQKDKKLPIAIDWGSTDPENFNGFSLIMTPRPPNHPPLKSFSCEVCGHTTSSSERLKEHLSRHSGIKHLKCDVCGKQFAWRYSLKSHMASHMENNPNKCTLCEKKFSNKSSLKNHIIRIHGNPKKDFKCEKCDKTFLTNSELVRHNFNHSEDKPFICEFCGNSYRFKAALTVHYKIHSGEKTYKCEYCEKEFIHLSSIIGHRRRHTGEKPFQCKECGKTFFVKRAMTSHMAVHTKEGKFRCEECGKVFKSRSGYHVHLDFHLGIKRHACKYCGKTFRAWCNMHKHTKRHLGEKPHKCEICGKTFIEKQELKNHLKSHNLNSQKQKKIPISDNIIASSDIIPPPSLNNSSCNIEQSMFGSAQHIDMIPHIDMTDNQVIYDCNISNAIDKCQTDKCQLLQDNYVSQFLYPQHQPVQYVPQSVPMQHVYPNADPDQNVQRSACLANSNSPNFNCVQLNNQAFNAFAYNLPTSDEIVSKCKLCRCLFNNSLLLRSHLLDYHRIDEENVDDLIT